jgi:hypothetical protein
MSYLRYLTAVNTSLREAVLPEITSGRGRDALHTAIAAIAQRARGFASARWACNGLIGRGDAQEAQWPDYVRAFHGRRGQ